MTAPGVRVFDQKTEHKAAENERTCCNDSIAGQHGDRSAEREQLRAPKLLESQRTLSLMTEAWLLRQTETGPFSCSPDREAARGCSRAIASTYRQLRRQLGPRSLPDE